MFSLLRVAIVTIVLTIVASQSVYAADLLALPGVARVYGFTYVTESSEGAVQLTRPGLSLLVRVGDPRYQVNDEVQYFTDAPVFRNNQLYVDATFERVLAKLAAAYPWPFQAVARLTITPLTPAADPVPMSINAKYVNGAESIAVSGTAPAGAPVSVSLSALMSRDIPVVTIAHVTVTSGADGHFAAILPASAVDLQNTTFIATAGTPGLEPVMKSVAVQPPNPNLHSPNDGLPKAK